MNAYLFRTFENFMEMFGLVTTKSHWDTASLLPLAEQFSLPDSTRDGLDEQPPARVRERGGLLHRLCGRGVTRCAI